MSSSSSSATSRVTLDGALIRSINDLLEVASVLKIKKGYHGNK